MAVNVYEGMFILDTNRYGRDPAAVSGQIPQMIEKAGGEILVSRLWEERRLAYPIKGHRKGTYWLTYFRLDAGELAGLEQQCRLNDSIFRELFLKVDPRIIDALVEHAQASSTTHADKKEAEKPPEDEGGAKDRKEAVAVADELQDDLPTPENVGD